LLKGLLPPLFQVTYLHRPGRGYETSPIVNESWLPFFHTDIPEETA
jgi:hypothetical protein